MATSKAMKTPPIVSQQEWEAAHQQLLVKEKAFVLIPVDDKLAGSGEMK